MPERDGGLFVSSANTKRVNGEGTLSMVEYRGTGTAWPFDAQLPVGAVIRPTTWAIAEGAMKPYEFEFVPGSENLGDDMDIVNPQIRSRAVSISLHA